MTRSIHNLLAGIALITLLMSGLLVAPRTHCSSTDSLLQNACIAESLLSPVEITWVREDGVVPTREFWIALSGLVLLLCTHLFQSIKRPLRGLTSLHRRLGPIRSGPAPNGQFLPYLYATHGL